MVLPWQQPDVSTSVRSPRTPPPPLSTPCLHGEQEAWRIYSSLKSSNAAAGVKTSSSPMTCRDGDEGS